MTWTQDMPTESGYYWIAEDYEDTPWVAWIEVDIFGEWMYDSFDNEKFLYDLGYWFYSQKIDQPEWK